MKRVNLSPKCPHCGSSGKFWHRMQFRLTGIIGRADWYDCTGCKKRFPANITPIGEYHHAFINEASTP